MHIVLICTSVIVQFYSVLSFTDEDITGRCLNHKTLSFTLTFGQETDSKSVSISGNKETSCTVEYFVAENTYIMGVVEFQSWYSENNFCVEKEASAITVSNFTETKECLNGKNSPTYSIANKAKLRVNFRDLGDSSQLRITATSMRVPGLYKCSSDREVECVYKQTVYCMNSVFTCDGIANCGVPNSYDEDLRKCTGLGVTPFMIFCTILMHIMSLLLIVSLCFTLTPKRRETFIYKVDQSMPLFDSDNGTVAYDIDVEVLYPKELKDVKESKSVKSVLVKK